jgi:crossover junction endodeoxyribonuclease RusA
MKLEIHGRPVPAVRMTQRSKFISKQAQRYLAYKDQIGWEAKAAGIRPTHSPYEVKANVYMDCTKRDMDVDNLAKAYLDGLNGIAWHDDRQVILLHIKKIYVTEDERAEIEIIEKVMDT